MPLISQMRNNTAKNRHRCLQLGSLKPLDLADPTNKGLVLPMVQVNPPNSTFHHHQNLHNLPIPLRTFDLRPRSTCSQDTIQKDFILKKGYDKTFKVRSNLISVYFIKFFGSIYDEKVRGFETTMG